MPRRGIAARPVCFSRDTRPVHGPGDPVQTEKSSGLKNYLRYAHAAKRGRRHAAAVLVFKNGTHFHGDNAKILCVFSPLAANSFLHLRLTATVWIYLTRLI